jgi:hypothetical protein
MQESEKIAAAAKLERNWPAATSALREARGCLELLGKLRGELQQPGALHLHKHAHIHSAAQPRNEVEIELEIARHVAAATANFDAQEIIRLKGLLETAGPQSSALPRHGSENGPYDSVIYRCGFGLGAD